VAPRKQEVEERGAGAAHVQVAGRRGSKADAHGSHKRFILRELPQAANLRNRWGNR